MGDSRGMQILFSAKKYDLRECRCLKLVKIVVYCIRSSVILCRKFEILLASLRRSQNTKIPIPSSQRKQLARKVRISGLPWEASGSPALCAPRGPGAVLPHLVRGGPASAGASQCLGRASPSFSVSVAPSDRGLSGSPVVQNQRQALFREILGDCDTKTKLFAFSGLPLT